VRNIHVNSCEFASFIRRRREKPKDELKEEAGGRRERNLTFVGWRW